MQFHSFGEIKFYFALSKSKYTCHWYNYGGLLMVVLPMVGIPLIVIPIIGVLMQVWESLIGPEIPSRDGIDNLNALLESTIRWTLG